MKTMILAVILLGFVATGAQCGSLFNEEMEGEKPPCCDEENLLSCVKISLNASALGDQELEIETLQESLEFKGMVGDSQTSYHYSNDEAEMVITYHANTGGAYGHISLGNGESFIIEYCGSHGHVMKEIDVKNLEETKGQDFEDDNSTVSMRMLDNRQGNADTTTIVTYTVKIYYTPQFEATTSDVSGFIDQVIAETNQGYINSQVPIRIKLHCIERATLNDNNDGEAMIASFRTMKGTPAALRGSADAAALLVNRLWNYCGIGYLNSIAAGNTVSVTQKPCALGYYTFGHELGHNLGLHHDTRIATNTAYSDGHGHLIAGGYHTIMAYPAPGHRTKANYYSNPAINLPITGTPTGVAGVSNNARVLTVNRFNMAAVGDESETCGDTTTTTTPSPTSTCIMENQYRYFQYSYIGRMSQSACRTRSTTTNGSIGWAHHNSRDYCYLNMQRARTWTGMSVGPSYENSACAYDTAPCVDTNSVLRTRYRGRFNNISSAGECDQACRSSSACQFWRWSRNVCYRWQTYYHTSSWWTSGPKYC